jgi:class 3 adenylate cyclase
MYERRIVTVLFADLVGFTALSERLDPEDVAAIQDAYFATVREAVARHGGVLEKFIGDAAMAAFGVPRTRDDDPERAVQPGSRSPVASSDSMVRSVSRPTIWPFGSGSPPARSPMPSAARTRGA